MATLSSTKQRGRCAVCSATVIEFVGCVTMPDVGQGVRGLWLPMQSFIGVNVAVIVLVVRAQAISANVSHSLGAVIFLKSTFGTEPQTDVQSTVCVSQISFTSHFKTNPTTFGVTRL